ncbi:MAG TPA: VOC family protein [Chloroflexota bacterium]|nr:VOC family protein [Chloroflexota bacterium]
MFNGLNFVIRHVSDVEAARAFYTEKLGFTVESEQPGFLQFKQPGAGATFALAREEPGTEPVELWWFVDDADATHARLRDQGVEIVSPPRDEPFGRAFAIKDQAGATLYLLQLRAR